MECCQKTLKCRFKYYEKLSQDADTLSKNTETSSKEAEISSKWSEILSKDSDIGSLKAKHLRSRLYIIVIKKVPRKSKEEAKNWKKETKEQTKKIKRQTKIKIWKENKR